ncbi:hypothetical protein QBZ16_002970 [Prototheca wickerhamii]|uniref:Bacterial surface antigen (D15) domain-containing protein n=1 Tax=Prototheca wickerhamii TaxID=3111 RepID=A0AAD9IIR5_PROWI|nr:hypothetical protein QBZ16_002970 [Prototheca wickerhamii]
MSGLRSATPGLGCPPVAGARPGVTVSGAFTARPRVILGARLTSCRQAARARGVRAAASAPEAPDGGSEPAKAVGLRSELLSAGIRALCVAAPLVVFPLAAVAAVTGGGGGGRGSRGGGGDDDEGDDFDGEDDDGAEFEESGFEEEEEEEEGSDEETEDRAPKGAGKPDVSLSVGQTFFCAELEANGLPTGEGIPTQDELFAGLQCQPGLDCSRKELAQDIKSLYATGLFERVNAKVLPAASSSGKQFKIVYDFAEKRYPKLQSFEVEGARVIPPAEIAALKKRLRALRDEPFSMKTMALIKTAIEGWYQARGYGLSYISHFTGMNTGQVVAHVNEGKTAKIRVVWMDDKGQPTRKPGNVSPGFILRHCPVEKGKLYNLADGRKTLQNVFSLDLFDNVQILPRQSERDPTKVEVDVMVKEKPLQVADIETEWALAADAKNRPSLVSLMPGGTITYENRNVGGKAATLAASINTKSFWNPAEDISYRLMYQLPYVFGLGDPQRTKLQATAFNARKLCGVFTPGPDGEEVPPVWVDRAGAKVALTQQFSRNSRGSLGLVAQEVTARDETARPGAVVPDGPPCTLGASGTDRLLYAQAALVRDTTYLSRHDGATTLGSRDIFTLDQGLGVGTGAPLFNRATASLTRFLPLGPARPRLRLGPPSLALHARAGAALGDLPAYDAFLLGGTLLQVRGNPTAYFRRAGAGSSVGAGVKLGAVRLETVRDNNAGRWHVLVHYGERF